MRDDKRQIRILKRSIKRSGNRKRRRFLKRIDLDPETFNFGADSSAWLNDQRAGRNGDEWNHDD